MFESSVNLKRSKTVNSSIQENKSQYLNYKCWVGKITDCELDEVMDTTPWECEPRLIYSEILYLIFDYPHKHYTFKHFEI